MRTALISCIVGCLGAVPVTADTIYRCGLKNGAPWFTINVKPRGARCVAISKPKPEPGPPAGVQCSVQRYRETSFFRCEKDGIVWFFNRNHPSATGARASSPQKPSTTVVNLGEDAGSLDSIVAAAAKESGVPEALIRAVIHVESRFQTGAVSPAGAQGLMQLMPVTASELAVEDPFDPEQNVRAGARLLRRLADRFQGDIERTIAAYYSGPSAVERAGGIPNASCAAYVQRVLERYRAYAGER